MVSDRRERAHECSNWITSRAPRPDIYGRRISRVYARRAWGSPSGRANLGSALRPPRDRLARTALLGYAPMDLYPAGWPLTASIGLDRADQVRSRLSAIRGAA
jgi:hypothetical protein